MKAVIPAAGLGTRMLPATKSMPKEMLPVLDKPVIQYVVEEAVASGCDEILIVTGRSKRAIEDHFDHNVELEQHLAGKGKTAELEAVEAINDLANIHYVRQKQPNGLGHAVLCAKTFIGDDDFGVLLGDDIYTGTPALSQLRDASARFGRAALAVMEVSDAEVPRYGIADPSEELAPGIQGLRGIVEKPSLDAAPSRLAAMGRYWLTPDIFDILADLPPGAGGEIQLTDALDVLAGRGQLCSAVVDGERLDAGDLLGWLEANLRVGLSGPHRAGVEALLRKLCS